MASSDPSQRQSLEVLSTGALADAAQVVTARGESGSLALTNMTRAIMMTRTEA